MNLYSGQEQRQRGREPSYGHSRRIKGWDKLTEKHGNAYITMCKIDSQWEVAVQPRELSLVLCDNLDGLDKGGVEQRFKREKTDVSLWLIHIVVQQKPTQHCKAIIFQLRIIFKKYIKKSIVTYLMKNILAYKFRQA